MAEEELSSFLQNEIDGASPLGAFKAQSAATSAPTVGNKTKKVPENDLEMDVGKEDGNKNGDGKKKFRFNPHRLLPYFAILLAVVFVSAAFRVKNLESHRQAPAPVAPAPHVEQKGGKKELARGLPSIGAIGHIVARDKNLAEVSPSIREVGSRLAGPSDRIVNVAHFPEADERESEEIAPKPVSEELPSEEPKVNTIVKRSIVKRTPVDMFEDAILETVKLLRAKPWDEATRAAVNSFSDITKKEKNRSRECYAVIAALNSAKTWDNLVAETLCEHPKKREIMVGNTKHVIVPTSTKPGAIVCKRYVDNDVLLNQEIFLVEMSPKEKLRILRSEPPNLEEAALYSRAFLELVHGSPKSFRAFVDAHKKIEVMKAFDVAYELVRSNDRNEP